MISGSGELALREAWLGRSRAFLHWRRTGSVAGRLALAGGAACVMGLLAQVRIQTPLTPVPFSGQTLGALAVGGLCGMELALISMSLYVVLGIAGVPWFAAAGSGAHFAWSPSAGYLVGFVLAAAFVGYITDRRPAARSFAPACGVMVTASLIVYACGVTGLMIATGVGPWSALAKGVLPFIPGDVIKVALAAGLVSAGLPHSEASPGSREESSGG